MKKGNKKATSIIEVLIILLIITIGILGAFNLFSSGQKLSVNTENKIQAINIAREAIEAVTNIRNTNWFLFSSDNSSCWNSLNYNQNCIGDNHNDNIGDKYISSGSYIVYSSGSKWFLEKKTVSGDYKDSSYRTNFKVNKTASGFFTQSGGIDFKPLFTRELEISYSGVGANTFSGSQMIVKSKVFWSDSSSKKPHKVILSTILTPWRD